MVRDRVRVDVWQHIWLNEGFATYAQWFWAEREGTPQHEISNFSDSFPDDDPFWQVVIGDIPARWRCSTSPCTGEGR